MQATILLCDDNREARELHASLLRSFGARVRVVASGEALLKTVTSSHDISLILLDMMMPDLDGFGVLERLRKLNNAPPVIVYLREAASDLMGSALKAGAADVLTLPLEGVRLRHSIKMQMDMLSLSKIKANAQSSHDLKQFASQTHPVLIEGEAGVGKSDTLRALIAQSDRSQGVVSWIACQDKISVGGLEVAFSRAQNGFLVLENINLLSFEAQKSLFSLINLSHKKSPRLLVTCDACLFDLTKQELFLSDLYYRLSLCPLKIRPLRDRVQDILPLAGQYLRQIARLEHKYILVFGAGVQDYLVTQQWLLNEAGLRQAIWRAVVLCEGDVLELSHFNTETVVKTPVIAHQPPVLEVQPHGFSLFKSGQLRQFDALEKDIYQHAMAHYAGNVSEVARKLGVGRSTLYRKLNEFGMISP